MAIHQRNGHTQWYRHTVIEQIRVESIQDSNGDGIGDFAGLLRRLDHFAERGIGCLWLTPFFPSGGLDGGYDVTDHKGVDPRYGTLEDFHRFVHAAHQSGIRVMVDWVPNHTSTQHPWFQSSRADPRGRFGDYYVWRDHDNGYPHIGRPFPGLEPNIWTFDPVRGQYYLHRFFKHQPDVNYENPAVRREMLDTLRFWLDRGVDGFRVDTPAALFEAEDSNGEGLPQTHIFYKAARAMLEHEYPGAVLLGEVCDTAAETARYFGDGDEFQAVMNFPAMSEGYLALARGDARRLGEALVEMHAAARGETTGNFLSNHDERSFGVLKGDERAAAISFYGDGRRGWPLYHGVASGFPRMLGFDRRAMELAYALMMSQPGIPMLYYLDALGAGDLSLAEMEALGIKDLRLGVRTPMSWEPSLNGGFSGAAELYLPAVTGNPPSDVASQRANPHSWLNFQRGLIQVWRDTTALAIGDFVLVGASPSSVIAWLRSWRGQWYLCVFNVADRPVLATLDLNALRAGGMLGKKLRFPHHGLTDLRSRAVLGEVRRDRHQLLLGPRQWYLAELSH